MVWPQLTKVPQRLKPSPRLSLVMRALKRCSTLPAARSSQFLLSVWTGSIRIVCPHPQCVSRSTACELRALRNPRRISVFCDGFRVRSLWRAVTQEENMTQLNLSGRQSNNTQQKPAAEHEDGSIKNQTVGALGALAMFAAVIVIGSCSRSSKPVAVQQPVQPTAPVSAPAATTPAPAPTPAPVVAKAKRSTGRRLFPTSIGSTDSHSAFPRNYS